MIRRDYILRTVAEMAQVLARVISLKNRQEYDRALKEINTALRKLRDDSDNTAMEFSLTDWIALCRKHEQAASRLMIAVGDLLKEQGDMLAAQDKPDGSAKSRALALGLILEGLLSGEMFVTAELLGKVEELFDQVRSTLSDSEVWRRLVRYFEARGRFARAEDTLFAWLAAGDLAAMTEGFSFYQRLGQQSDTILEQGDLPRAELEQGRREFEAAGVLRIPHTG
jgi:tetratricopeptide (TPR) repeat protein